MPEKKEAHCHNLLVRARLLLPANIAPYLSWAITFDRSSPKAVNATIEERPYTVNYSHQLQRTRFYYAAVTDRYGMTVDARVEIPERPYMPAFLEDQRRLRR